MFGFTRKTEFEDKIIKELNSIKNTVNEWKNTRNEKENLQEEFHQQELRQKKQQNMLEELLELADETTESVEKCNDMLEKIHRNHTDTDQEQKLIDIIMMYDEYLTQSQTLLASQKVQTENDVTQTENSASEHVLNQQELVQKSLDRYLMAGQLGRIYGDDQPVQLDQMQVIQIEKTQDETLDNIVKQTVVPGWIYKGNVTKKAKVIVWKYREDTDE